MAQVLTPTADERVTSERPGRGPIDWLGGWRTCLIGCTVFLLLAIAIRIFQQFTAWTIGIDSASRDFSLYYRSLFVAEVVGVTLATLMWWGSLVRRGRVAVNKEITHGEEVRRVAVFWGLVGTTCVILYIMASFWPNQDGSWHQTAVRDTALTPAHIPMFFLFFPLGITFTIGTYLYGRYWLPKVYGAEKGFPWSFFLLIFAVPFHWPFVFYGWLAAGIFALWAETLVRLLQIEGEIEQEAAVPEEEVA